MPAYVPWLFAICLPLLAALLLVWPAARPVVLAFAPWTALPALGLIAWADLGPPAAVPWMLFQTRLGLDETGRVFLLFTAALWLIAGLYARTYMVHDEARPRFFAFFLVTMTGNLGLILARDMTSFYFFFALMSFASYGLIVHDGDPKSMWAGRIYIILVVVGEILLFIGIMMIVSITRTMQFDMLADPLVASPFRHVVAALLMLGFGIKAGALPLHVWLPLAHPAAPTPASAVLSGAIIKAGLLGWLRFLPLEVEGWPLTELGMILLIAGLAAAFFGVLVGITQDNPKIVLAYSSISQMGFMTVGVGAGLMMPEYWAVILPAIWVYALHHALAKGALFLGVGVASAAGARLWQRLVVLAGLLLPALALAGVPFTSGAVAKISLKKSLEPHPWFELLEPLLSLAAVGTTLLMARFLVVVWPAGLWRWGGQEMGRWGGGEVRRSGDEEMGSARPQGTGLGSSHLPTSSSPHLPTHPPLPHAPALPLFLYWLLVVAGSGLLVWYLPWEAFQYAAQQSLDTGYLWANLWPVLLGTALALVGWCLYRLFGLRLFRIPAGDLLAPVVWLTNEVKHVWEQQGKFSLYEWSEGVRANGLSWWNRNVRGALARLEEIFDTWGVVGLLFLTIAAILLALLVL